MRSESQSLQELTSQLMGARSKTHNNHRSVLQKSQFGENTVEQLANKQSAEQQAREQNHAVRAQKGEIVHEWHNTRLLGLVCDTNSKILCKQHTT